MPGKNIRGIVLLAAGALVLAGIAWVMHREIGARGVAPVAAAMPPDDPAGDSNSLVVRFVKNPELAPAFQARDITGKPVSKADWTGKVVLVNFWATWTIRRRKC